MKKKNYLDNSTLSYKGNIDRIGKPEARCDFAGLS